MYEFFRHRRTEAIYLGIGLTTLVVTTIVGITVYSSLSSNKNDLTSTSKSACNIFLNPLTTSTCNLTSVDEVFVKLCNAAFERGYSFVKPNFTGFDTEKIFELCEQLPSYTNITTIGCEKTAQTVCLLSAWGGHLWNMLMQDIDTTTIAWLSSFVTLLIGIITCCCVNYCHKETNSELTPLRIDQR